MFKKVSHIGIAVRDLDAALALYRRLFGLEASHQETRPEFGVKLAMVSLGDTHLELIQPLDPQGAIGQYIAKKGEGVHHLCLEVDDIEQSLKTLAARGAALIDREPRPGVEGKVAFLHPKAAQGVLIELVERGE